MSDRLFYTHSPYINVMVKAVLAAAKGLLRDFSDAEKLKTSSKGFASPVSSADNRAEKTIFSVLKRAYPDAAFVMEETGAHGDNAEMTFFVDPLDGTSNFLMGLPHFSISIALKENGTTVAAVIFDPVRDELFWAVLGEGSFLGRKKLRLGGNKKHTHFLLGTGSQTALTQLKKASNLILRISGSAVLDLAYVASGRLDGFWGQNLAPWDYAAGTLLIQEAKGFCSIQDQKNKKSHIWASGIAPSQGIKTLLQEPLTPTL